MEKDFRCNGIPDLLQHTEKHEKEENTSSKEDEKGTEGIEKKEILLCADKSLPGQKKENLYKMVLSL